MLLKNATDINNLVAAIAKCRGDVLLRSVDGTEEFNLKSTLSQYMGIARLCAEKGEFYEIYCTDKNDEPFLFHFFNELNK